MYTVQFKVEDGDRGEGEEIAKEKRAKRELASFSIKVACLNIVLHLFYLGFLALQLR